MEKLKDYPGGDGFGGGGGTVSLKHDAQGKTLAAALLRMELDI